MGWARPGNRRNIYFDSDSGGDSGLVFFRTRAGSIGVLFSVPRPFSRVNSSMLPSLPLIHLSFCCSPCLPSIPPFTLSLFLLPSVFFVAALCDLPPTWDAIGLLYPSASSMAVAEFAFFAEEAAWWDEC